MKNRIIKVVSAGFLLFTIVGCSGSDTEDTVSNEEGSIAEEGGIAVDGRVSEGLVREPNQIHSFNALNGSVGLAYPLHAVTFELQGCSDSLNIYPWSEDQINVETECLQVVPLNNDLFSGTSFDFLSNEDIQTLNTEFDARGGFYISASGEPYILEESRVDFLPCPINDELSCSLPLVNGQIEIPNGEASVMGISVVLRPSGQLRDVVVFYLDLVNPSFPFVLEF